jgi:hypothetical protein
LPSSIQFDSRGSPSTFGDDSFGLRPRRYSSTRGARRLTSATTSSIFALVDIVWLDGLSVHLRRRLLQPLPSSIQFDSRGSPSTFGDDYFGLRLVDTVRLEGLAIHIWQRLLQPSPSSLQFDSSGSPSTFGDDYFDLRPRQYSST